MRFSFIRTEKATYPVTVLCRVLEVSRSGYYAFEKHLPSTRDNSDRELAVEIRAVHKRSRQRYGSPRIHRELRRRNLRVGRKRVVRLMRAEGIMARSCRRFCRTTDSNHPLPVAENVLARKFTAESPNQVWVTDITYIDTCEGWLYLAPVLDLFSRRVVGFAMSETIDRRLVLDALENALRERLPPHGLIHHSDRGSQYASGDYRIMLRKWGIVPSMSRRGNCWDNAVAESFFGTLKRELTQHETYETRDAARAAITDYIENFYNSERSHSTLDYLSPIEYELKHQIDQLTP